MNRSIRLFSLVLAMSCILSGCSRQSTTDFTPYPSNQAVVRLALAPAEKEITLSSKVELKLDEVRIGMQTITPIEPSAGAVSPNVRAHTNAEESATQETPPSIDDPNVESGDNRPLVPISLAVNAAVSLLEPRTFGSASLRAGAATGWKLACVPVSMQEGELSVYVQGTAKLNGNECPIRVMIVDPFEVTFATRSGPSAGMTDNVGLHFHVGEWFENLGLETLIGPGSTEILIDEDNQALHEKLLENLKQSTTYEGVHP